jgi:hypothetical protein
MPVCLLAVMNHQETAVGAWNSGSSFKIIVGCAVLSRLRSKCVHGLAVFPPCFNTMLARFLGGTIEHRVQHSTTRWHIAKYAWFAVRIKKREDEKRSWLSAWRWSPKMDLLPKYLDFSRAVFIRKMWLDSNVLHFIKVLLMLVGKDLS